MGAALTTTGRVGTARRPGSGKRDGEVYVCRNQWWNPLKWTDRLEPGGYGPVSSARPAMLGAGDSESGLGLAGPEAMGKACGVPVARLQGKSWAPIPSNGQHGERGNHPGSPFLPPSQGGGGQARRQLMARRWGGVLVVVRGRESRPHGEGGQRVRSRRDWKVRRSPVNTDAPWPGLIEAEPRVLRIQTKLHRWATDDPRRRFDDLYNLVCDPAVPGGCVGSGAGQSRGTVGRRGRSGPPTPSSSSVSSGSSPSCETISRLGRFRPLPVRERMIPKPGGKLPAPGHPDRAGPGRASRPQAGARADLRGGLPAVFATASARSAEPRTRSPRSTTSHQRPAPTSGCWRGTSRRASTRSTTPALLGPGASIGSETSASWHW